MKKILGFFLLFLAAPSGLNGQPLNGLGSYASPYNGIFEGDLQWDYTNFPDGKVFINGDVTIDNELLTIQAGMSIIFINEGADLIISGTGQINASGNSGSKIIFTADDDNDGTYGETGERRGHIVFWNMNGSAGNSRFEYCTIEYADVSGSSNTSTFGGGIYLRSFSNISLINCTISNNKSSHGGGIMAQNYLSPSNPSLTGCIISQNTATSTGGGLYLHNECSSLITNCIISNNSAGVEGGGGIYFRTCSAVKIINSIIVKNTTSSSNGGYNVLYHYISDPTIRPKFTNCIVWDNDNSISHMPIDLAYTYRSSDFLNCALKDISTPASFYTNCIDLSSTNNDINGPNFRDPDLPIVDWSIVFSSPCRDAGTTPSPAVPNDFDGYTRIGQYDIGAYEVKFNRWKTSATSSDWGTAENWDLGVPTSSQDIAIPSGAAFYPTEPSSQDYTIGAGHGMVVDALARVTLDNLTNNGTLVLTSLSSGTASLILNSYVKGAGSTEEIQLYLTGGWVKPPPYNEGRWHYISSPFSAPLLITPFSNETLDLAHWVDGINSEGSIIPGWVAYDRFVYDVVVQPSPLPAGFTHLDPGKGYNFWDDKSSNTYNLSGQLNTADVIVNLAFAGDPIYQGFNLLGNPFPAGLDWDFIINNTTFPDNTGQGIYFTHENVQYSYVSGVAVPEFGIPASSGIIPPMQGFFVKTHGSGNSITLAAGAQVHSAPNRYKGSVAIPLIRLSLTEDSVSGDETVVRFDEKALTSLDNNFDALKMFLSPAKTAIYSILGTTKYSINGQPFPDTFVEIPITINIQNSGNQIIKASRIDYLDNYTITLKDNSTGFTADLRTSPELSFFADAPGTLTGRFILKVSNVLTATEELPLSANTFNVYSGNNMINIQTLSDDWEGKSGSVRIMDLSGRIFNTLPNAEFRKGSLIQIGATTAKGMYVVEIRSGVKRYVGKVVVR